MTQVTVKIKVTGQGQISPKWAINLTTGNITDAISTTDFTPGTKQGAFNDPSDVECQGHRSRSNFS